MFQKVNYIEFGRITNKHQLDPVNLSKTSNQIVDSVFIKKHCALIKNLQDLLGEESRTWMR